VLPLTTTEAPTSHFSAINIERRSHILPSRTSPAKSLEYTTPHHTNMSVDLLELTEGQRDVHVFGFADGEIRQGVGHAAALEHLVAAVELSVGLLHQRHPHLPRCA